MVVVLLLLAILALMVAMVIVGRNNQREQVRVPARIQRPRVQRRR